MHNLEEAIQTHVQWKIKLLTAVNGGQLPDRKASSADNVCALGKWLHGEGGTGHGQLVEFKSLKDAHKHFHDVVGATLDLALARKIPEAKASIRDGDFPRASSDVVMKISQLKSKV